MHKDSFATLLNNAQGQFMARSLIKHRDRFIILYDIYQL
jgi:hypothetical protein